VGRLFWKFFFFIFMAQATAIVGMGAAVWLRDMASAKRALEIDDSPPVAFHVESAALTLRYGGPAALRSQLENTPLHRQIYAVDETGHELLGRSATPAMLVQARHALTQRDGPQTVREVAATDGHTYLLFALARDGRPGGRPPYLMQHPPSDKFVRPAIERGDPMENRGPPNPPHHMIPFIPMLVGALVSLVFAALLAWYFSKPIRSLHAAFDAAAEGKLDVRLGPTMGRRHDELADLGRDFDRMATQWQALMEGQRRLLHDVSHELRSPLARLQAAIGLARQQPEKMQASMERVERESLRMDKLVGELLTLSRLEAGVMGAMDEDIHMDELLATVADDTRFEAETNQRGIMFSGDGAVVVRGSAELLHRAIENVVRNAIRHTPTGSSVHVHVQPDDAGKFLQLIIRDEGPGVSEPDLERIFAPFFRGVDNGNDGHGLGLAIARQIVEAHGGTIRASNRFNGGLCVTITLPTA
jgi:two-component system OmpR family sensor kinase